MGNGLKKIKNVSIKVMTKHIKNVKRSN